jgi:hypothetical protein
VTLLILYLLASLDGLLCGCRAWMGRCALIHKHSYYLSALWQGFLGAQAVSALALLALFTVSLLSPNRPQLRADLELAAGRMLWLFLPYAAIVLISLALRAIPSMDIRSATSIFSLGPLTAVRPIVMIAGVLYGVSAAHLRETRLLGLIILGLMLSLELCLNTLASRQQLAALRHSP